MNEIIRANINELTIESREVAEVVEKKHSELLKDIRRYIEYLAEGNFHLGDFFRSRFDFASRRKSC